MKISTTVWKFASLMTFITEHVLLQWDRELNKIRLKEVNRKITDGFNRVLHRWELFSSQRENALDVNEKIPVRISCTHCIYSTNSIWWTKCVIFTIKSMKNVLFNLIEESPRERKTSSSLIFSLVHAIWLIYVLEFRLV